MTHTEILERAIRKAVDGGWKFQPFGDRYFPNYLSADGLVGHIAATINDLRLNAVIFNHDFAKALWGERLGIGDGDITQEFEGISSFSTPPQPAWQYHLQQMVIAEDPIKYIGEHL